MINGLAIIDVFSNLLLTDNDLKNKTKKLQYPSQLIEDFGVELSMDNLYMKNDKYIALWEYIHFKVQTEISDLKPKLITFKSHEFEFITYYINPSHT